MTTVDARTNLDFETAKPQSVAAPRHRLRNLFLLGTFLAGVWFLPAMVAHSPIKNWLLARLVGGLNGHLHVGQLTLGWFSPVTLDNLEIRDAQGGLLLQVASLASDKSLVSWIVDRADAGRVRIVDPELRIVFGAQATNVETVFANWIAADRPVKPSTQSTAQELENTRADLEISGGTIILAEEHTARTCRIEQLTASVTTGAGSQGPLHAKAGGQVAQDRLLAPLSATLELAESAAAARGTAAHATLACEGFPLWVAAAAARRVLPGCQLDGQLQSELTCDWTWGESGIDRLMLDANLAAQEFRGSAPWLGNDRLRLASLRAPCRLTLDKNLLRIERLALDCDLGQANCVATIDTAAGWWKSLTSQPYQVQGHVDLTRLAAALPDTVRVREATEITEGQLDLALAAEQRGQGLVWNGHLETTQLVAVNNGRKLSWDKPVSLVFDAHETADGIVVDKLYGESDFLELQGSGTPEDGQISASFNLDRLAAELGHFVDLGALRLAGDGMSHLAWQRDREGIVQASIEVDAQKFELTRPNCHPWVEPQLNVTCELVGQEKGASLERLDRAQLRLCAGQDTLDARLLQPVVQFDRGTLWPCAVELRGELARWLPRVEPWIGQLAGYELAGDCDLAANVVWSSVMLELEPLRASVRRFHCQNQTVSIDEPLVELMAEGRWASEDRRFDLTQARWTSSALTAAARDVQIAMASTGPPTIKGAADYTGDLNRLWSWLHTPASPSTTQLVGRLSGKAQIHRTGNLTNATFDNTVDGFQAVWSQTQQWQEPRVRLSGQFKHDATAKTLELSSFELASQAAACTASGRVTDLEGQRNLELDGKVRYDLARLQPLWQQWTGTGLQFAGSDQRPFSIRGSLAAPGAGSQAASPIASPAGDRAWLRQVNGSAGIAWSTGQAYGFPLGAGDLEAKLRDGVLNVQPLDVSASGGRVHLAPSLRLAPSPVELLLPSGEIASQVQITPQMCDQALKYIAPVLAGVTEAQGRFSVSIEGCRLPLSQPGQGDLAGQLKIHSVEIGPGPLVQELTVLLNRPAAARLSQESVVDFRMVEGRIYHRGMELIFPDVTIRTYGSVGLDQTLAIMTEMPVPPKWIGNNPLGDSIKNQIIHLPIGGTLSHPKIDERALAQANSQFLRNTATGVLKNELFRQLDKVFGPPK